jgi:Co/Zn/Cd efflux system component
MTQPVVPQAEIMGLIGVLALAVNTLCFYLLWQHRADDINMRSVWLCSRNDLFANSAVLVAALAVFWSASRWPDIVVGLAIAALFLHSAWLVLREAIRELRTPPVPPVQVTLTRR